jgi:hypothetical protein
MIFLISIFARFSIAGTTCVDGTFNLASSVKGLHRRFTYNSIDIPNGVWSDISSNGRDGNIANLLISKTCEAGNGASSSVCYVQGSIYDTVDFGPNSIPPVFTICSVSRYTSFFSQSRIISATDAAVTWVHGHRNGLAGVAYYGSAGYRTQSAISAISPNTNWLVMCGQNSFPNMMTANGVDVTLGTGGEGGVHMYVNVNGLSSAWGIMEITVWNRSLSIMELQQVNGFYSNVLSGTQTLQASG